MQPINAMTLVRYEVAQMNRRRFMAAIRVSRPATSLPVRATNALFFLR